MRQENGERHRTEKLRKRHLRRIMAVAVITVLAIAGLSYKENRPSNPKAVTSTEAPIKPQGEKIDNPELSVGKKVSLVEGVFTIHTDKLNVRKQPRVIEDTGAGESNKFNLTKDIDVVNPVFVRSDEFGNHWFVAFDAKAKAYYFTSNNGGISEKGDNKNVTSFVEDTTAKVEATTTSGNSGVTKDGRQIMLATVVELANNQG